MKEGLLSVKQINSIIFSITGIKSEQFEKLTVNNVVFYHTNTDHIQKLVNAFPKMPIGILFSSVTSLGPSATDIIINSVSIHFSNNISLQLTNCQYLNQTFNIEMFQINELVRKTSTNTKISLVFSDNSVKIIINGLSIIFDPIIANNLLSLTKSPLIQLLNMISSIANEEVKNDYDQLFKETQSKRIEFEFQKVFLCIDTIPGKESPFFLMSISYNGFMDDNDWEMHFSKISAYFSEKRTAKPYYPILKDFSF